jgi:pimeloyl-ACP methyl ester carboxylesterase
MFLPGAAGRVALWQPVAERLEFPGEKIHVGWPGFGPVPADASITGLDDLAARVSVSVDRPTALLAQSMGGVVALRVALEKPDFVTHLVLSVTSGGVDMSRLGGQDWRPAFQAANPGLPRWFLQDRSDLTARLPEIRIPTLLLWGDADPISPVAVGRRLAALLPNARLHVVRGGDHDLVESHADEVAPLIATHLNSHTGR